MTPELLKKYREEVVSTLMSQFEYKNTMQVPRLKKIVVNVGVGDARDNRKLVEASARELESITGQKPVITAARKSLSNFKIREGMPIGVKVTLRGARMYDFMSKLIHASLPRERDFQGLSRKKFDGRGNYNLGVQEQLIFPEINYDDLEKVRGMNITFVTSANTNEESLALLEGMGMPFVKARSN